MPPLQAAVHMPAGEFEEPTTLDVYNNTKYALVLQKFHCNRGEILSNRGEPVDRVHARQGIAKTIVRCGVGSMLWGSMSIGV